MQMVECGMQITVCKGCSLRYFLGQHQNSNDPQMVTTTWLVVPILYKIKTTK